MQGSERIPSLFVPDVSEKYFFRGVGELSYYSKIVKASLSIANEEQTTERNEESG
jgi:hypothetical protein